MWTTLVGLFTKRLMGKAAGLTNAFDAVKSVGQGLGKTMSQGQSDAASQLTDINTVGAGASQETGMGAGAPKEMDMRDGAPKDMSMGAGASPGTGIGAGITQFVDAIDTISNNRRHRV